MKIRTELAYPPNNWTAVDDETYDGPGSPIGSGKTEQEAIEDLMEKLGSELDPKSLAVAMGSIGIEKQDGPSYADIQERWALDANNGATDD